MLEVVQVPPSATLYRERPVFYISQCETSLVTTWFPEGNRNAPRCFS